MTHDTIFPSGINVPVDIPYNSDDFYGHGAMTWEVLSNEVDAFWYSILSQHMVLVTFYVSNTNLGGNANDTLYIKLPVHLVPVQDCVGTMWVINGTLPRTGVMAVYKDDALIQLNPGTANADWDVSSLAYLGGQLTYRFK